MEKVLDNVFVLNNFNSTDRRGSFTKVYNYLDSFFDKTSLKEVYYSTSNKNVLRGMHYQICPYQMKKYVHLIEGKVLDVVVNINPSSKEFGKYFSITLTPEKTIFMNEDYAHGFYTLSETATMLYLTTEVYSKSHDTGILWNTFDYDWDGLVKNPILSDRDKKFKALWDITK